MICVVCKKTKLLGSVCKCGEYVCVKDYSKHFDQC